MDSSHALVRSEGTRSAVERVTRHLLRKSWSGMWAAFWTGRWALMSRRFRQVRLCVRILYKTSKYLG